MKKDEVRNRLAVRQAKFSDEYQDLRASLAELVAKRGHDDPAVQEAKRKLNTVRSSVEEFYTLIRLAR